MSRRIGIDLGGTKTEVILTEENVLQEVRRRRVPTQQERGYEFIIEQIAELVSEFQEMCDEPPVIGMGIPGSLFPQTGLVRNANTQCLIGKPLKKDLEKLVNSPVTIENDANCFALSEALLGAGKNHTMVAGVIMGTGMGGGIIYEGKLWKGQHGIAGEWGHSSINVDGPSCWCGQKGCMELYLSGTGIQHRYQEKTGFFKNVREIYESYEHHTDQASTSVIQETMFYFGRAMANLIDTLDPNIIVIGGGISNLEVLYSDGVRQTAAQLFNPELQTPIVKNELGDSSGVYGAALLAGNTL
ncbi:MAG: ROK family protein [SAR324 cluster bacterium]|nr:ROK family protein [SAR324 cluster bacterium]